SLETQFGEHVGAVAVLDPGERAELAEVADVARDGRAGDAEPGDHVVEAVEDVPGRVVHSVGEVFGDFERGGVRAAVVAGCDQPPCCAKPRTRAGSTRLRALDFLVGAAYE